MRFTALRSKFSAFRTLFRGACAPNLVLAMAGDETRHLRVLIANEKRERLDLLARVVSGLGTGDRTRDPREEVGAVTARERPDVALVGLGLHSEHALELISEIVHEASCPVIALLSAKDPAYVHEAAKRGVFAYIVDARSRLRARSTSPSSASRSTTVCKEHSGAGQ